MAHVEPLNIDDLASLSERDRADLARLIPAFLSIQDDRRRALAIKQVKGVRYLERYTMTPADKEANT